MEALEGLVGTSFSTGRKQEAIQAVDEALKRNAPSAGLYTVAGRAYLTAGNPAKAEEFLKKAIDLEPAKLQAYGLLGQLYISQKRLGDARDQFTELTKKNPQSVPANTMLGMIMEAQRDLPAAEAQYQKTLGVDADAAVAANNLAWLYVSSNRNLDQALQLAQTAAKQLGEVPAGERHVGLGLLPQGLVPARGAAPGKKHPEGLLGSFRPLPPRNGVSSAWRTR